KLVIAEVVVLQCGQFGVGQFECGGCALPVFIRCNPRSLRADPQVAAVNNSFQFTIGEAKPCFPFTPSGRVAGAPQDTAKIKYDGPDHGCCWWPVRTSAKRMGKFSFSQQVNVHPQVAQPDLVAVS